MWKLSAKLTTTKLKACGCKLPALNTIQNYLANRKQRTKINCSYNSWNYIVCIVPKGLFLGCCIYKWYDFVVKDINIGSYADDTVLYGTGGTAKDVSKTTLRWKHR